jgi:hypothetical protein
MVIISFEVPILKQEIAHRQMSYRRLPSGVRSLVWRWPRSRVTHEAIKRFNGAIPASQSKQALFVTLAYSDDGGGKLNKRL